MYVKSLFCSNLRDFCTTNSSVRIVTESFTIDKLTRVSTVGTERNSPELQQTYSYKRGKKKKKSMLKHLHLT